MERIESKYQALIKSQNAFERALQLYKNPPAIVDQALQEALTASVIKHFELFYETFWKYLKLYLNSKFGVDVTGSKTIFRAIHDQRLISEAELKKLLEIVEIRNATTHVYDEERAKKLSMSIIDHFSVMKKIVQAVDPSHD